MHPAESIVVFTTPERCDLFRAAFGPKADYRLNPYESMPLDITLENARAGGGTLAVVDEDHFMSPKGLMQDLCAYLDRPHSRERPLRIVVVSSHRGPDSPLLAFVAGYLGIYDIVYGCNGSDMVNELAELLERPRARTDCLELLQRWRDTLDDQPDDPPHDYGQAVSAPDTPHGKDSPENIRIKLSIQVSLIDSN